MVVIAIPFISGDCGTDQVGPRSVKVTRNSEKIGLFYDLSKMHTAFRLRRPDRVNSAGERQQFSSTSKHKLTTRQSRSKAIRIASSSCRIFSIEGAAVLSYNTDGLAATGLCDCQTPQKFPGVRVVQAAKVAAMTCFDILTGIRLFETLFRSSHHNQGRDEGKMEERAKFVQITTASAYDGNRLRTSVHALDSNGEVWEFRRADNISNEGKWVRLTNETR
jgi:hypothetical protein